MPRQAEFLIERSHGLHNTALGAEFIGSRHDKLFHLRFNKEEQ